ncbi:MAG: transglycosylase domain-containing protein, partial [Pseudomonadota bacterium]
LLVRRRTMEMYLNVAEWGDGIFGIEAAARLRFNKSAKDLTEREAALLAAVLPSPNKWRVDPPGPYVNQRTGTIQARMRVVERDGLAKCVLGTR